VKIVPLTPTPSQVLTIALGGQACQINVYQKRGGLYVDLSVNDQLIIGGVIGLNLNRIVRSVYLGFIGDLAFVDTQGSNDPDYTGLGDRYLLAYLEAADLASIGFAA
jgi:hypothetical protein